MLVNENQGGKLSAMKRGSMAHGGGACAVIVAGGRGRRMGSRTPKALLSLKGRPLFLHSLERFAALPEVRQIVLVLPADHLAGVRRRWEGRLGRGKPVRMVAGGATRHASVRRGVEAADPSCGVVLVHDAARPFVSAELIRRVCRAAARTGAALPALQPAETVKQADGRRLRTLDRRRIWLAQTPQGFRSDKLARALERLGRRARGMTDDVQLFETLGWPVEVVAGDPANIKITWSGDLPRVARRRGSS